MVQSDLERKPMTFAFNSTRFAFTFTEVTNELLSSVSVSSICIFPFLQCPSYISKHWMQYWTQNATEQNLKLSTSSWNRTCPYQLWSPRRCSNHLSYQLPTIDQESKSSLCESTWKSTFYQPLLSSGASKEIPTKTNVMPNTNIIILSVSNTWQRENRILSF